MKRHRFYSLLRRKLIQIAL